MLEGKILVILRRNERAMVRAMCGVKLVDKKTTKELMDRLGLNELQDMLSKVNGVMVWTRVEERR